MSWPLLSPALPPAAVVSPATNNSKSVRIITPTRAIPSYRARLSGPTKDASEDYHNFIEAVGKSSRTPVFDEPAEDRYPATAEPNSKPNDKSKSCINSIHKPHRIPIGTTRLFDHGRMRTIPLPSPNPRDPLNLPDWRKWAAVAAMSLIGGIAVGTNTALDNLLPVFSLEYAGVSPHAIQHAAFSTLLANSSASAPSTSINFTAAIAPLLSSTDTLPPTDRIQLLTTVPLLTAAAASYFQVPLSEAFGRRPVLLLSTACTWAGAVWAGLSSSSAVQSLASEGTATSALTQHIAARALIGVGAGTVNALVPLIAAHDLYFMHQRHLVLAVSIAIQALVTAGFVAAAPHLAAVYDWRWLYYISGIGGFVAWLGVVAFVPETRWTMRTRAQLCGTDSTAVFVDELAEHQRMARLDYYGYGMRTLWTDVGVFVVRPFAAWQWSRAGHALLDIVRTALLPPVLWVAAVQAVLLVASRAMAELTVDTLLVSGSSFSRAGLAGIAWAAAAVLAAVIGGVVAGDGFSLSVTQHLRAQQKQKYQRLSMSIMAAADITKTSRDELNAKLRSILKQQTTVRREAEHNLPGLVLPLAMGIAGCFFYGVILDRQFSSMDWMLVSLIAASSFLATAMFLFFVGSSVYLIESYPIWAGPCLVHAHSLRHIAAYLLATSNTTDAAGTAGTADTFRSLPVTMVAKIGALEGWAVFAEVLLVLSLGLPALFFGGRWVRAWAAGTVQATEEADDDEDDNERRAHKQRASHSPAPSDLSAALSQSDYAPSSPSTSPPPPSSPPAPSQPARYTAPHPGTRADIVFPRESIQSESEMTGRAM
ncbi:major facilitator superfamily transporter [Ophiostoma piceae UAMH 11346]|uniref:Major facilitator superfamily transporter n=1 Tax=Ophiostoma piceae (strain UAMH 11346) TaxID=1262450 RepID=S3CPR3_OPHP1|nr:major facilitator superfamily transporter [Ophiostoma piceae UAMH 11346]